MGPPTCFGCQNALTPSSPDCGWPVTSPPELLRVTYGVPGTIKEIRAKLRDEQIGLARQRLARLPEGAKVAIGVALGIVAIVALFAIVLSLAQK